LISAVVGCASLLHEALKVDSLFRTGELIGEVLDIIVAERAVFT